MAAFLLFDKITTWYGSSGQLLAGGQFRFFEAGTMTPKDVYGDRALTVNNGHVIALDASGRLAHECWADTTASYYVELYDADGVKHGEISRVEVPGGQGQVIPVPAPGEYLSGDGTNFLAVDLSDRLLPDQTGHSNKILGTDGATASWVPRPADGAPGVSDTSYTSNSVRVGKMLYQFGSDTAPASGSISTTRTVTFPTAYVSPPRVFVIPVGGTQAGSAPPVTYLTSAPSNTSFSVAFDVAEGDRDSSNMINPVPFMWMAVGEIA